MHWEAPSQAGPGSTKGESLQSRDLEGRIQRRLHFPADNQLTDLGPDQMVDLGS